MDLAIEFSSSPSTFLLIFLGGILTSFTPCIFPMIPITLSILGAHSLKQSRLRSFFISIIYVLGIATTYSLLGVFVAKSGMLFGSYLANPYVVGSLALLFIGLGLSFYDLYEIQLPQFIRQRIGKKNFKKNYTGAFLSGLAAGIVASPCVGPVLIALLAHVAKSQNITLGFLYLFTYAMGLGMIFIVLGTFSHLINKVPKSGPWLNSIKFVFGTILILMSAYYLRPLLSSGSLKVYIGALLVLIFLANTLFKKKPIRTWLQPQQIPLILILLVGFGFVIQGSFFSPEVHFHHNLSSNWKPYSKQAVQAAKGSQYVVIDFWAEWCEACHTLEKQTFSDPEVKNILDEFLLLKMDATHNTEKVSEILYQYDVVGLPYIAFIDKDGVFRKELTLTGYEKPKDFLIRLQKLTESPAP